MQKRVFICHRPYHILRSCCIINDNKDEATNVLITFDVKKLGENSFQRFKTNELFYSSFNQVVELPRTIVPNRRSILEYLKYCGDKQRQYKDLVGGLSDISEVYFFSDDEIEIQLLVDLILRKNEGSIKSVLVDEGVATYLVAGRQASKQYKLYSKFIAFVLGMRHFNYSGIYGKSNLYNYSLANNPEKASFHHPIEKMPPLSEGFCSKIRKGIEGFSNIGSDSHYVIYVGTYLNQIDRELQLINQINAFCSSRYIPFFIKLHPLQEVKTYKDYSSSMIDKGYPIELFYSTKSIIIGSVSSALYNASLLGCPTFDISSLLGEKEKGVADSLSWTGIINATSMTMLENQINSII